MDFSLTAGTSQQGLSLLDAAMEAASGGNPAEYLIAQLETSLRSSGSTWAERKNLGPTVSGAWYAQDSEGRAYWSSRRYAEAEIYLANWMRARNQADTAIALRGAGLTASQSAAARICLENQISCLSGLPGTGKTYTCRAIAESLAGARLSVVGCAFTGIAASRLQESAQIQATTIHRLLGWRGPKEGYTVNTVSADVVIVDECSMLDNQLLLSLVSRLRKDARLIMVGDPYQLASIEPSDCFRELCKVLPHARLTEVLRQEKDSPIGRAAQAILAGNVPQNEDGESGGGCYVVQNDSLGIHFHEGTTKQRREKNHPLTVAERMAIADGTELRFVRTMASTNDMVDRLNHIFTVYKTVKSEHPVMCILNNHDLRIYNGDIGYKAWRKYQFGDQCIWLPPNQVRDAWATTVNKVQGQECQSGQLVIEPTLTIRAAYTALTRARHRFCFTGNVDLLEKRLHADEEPRITLLAGLIQGSVKYTDTTC